MRFGALVLNGCQSHTSIEDMMHSLPLGLLSSLSYWIGVIPALFVQRYVNTAQFVFFLPVNILRILLQDNGCTSCRAKYCMDHN